MKPAGSLPESGRVDPDHTVIVPRPGARRLTAAATVRASQRPPAPEPLVASQAAPGTAPPDAATPTGRRGLAGARNALLDAAQPLLDLAVPLRTAAAVADIDALRARLVQGVREFEAAARASRADLVAISSARYALCTLLDEAIAGTPWGDEAWSARSLLVTFHNEASGGEKFFAILDRLQGDPRANIDALELFHVCLALGFEGRYRLVDGGRDRLSAVREHLWSTIRVERAAADNALSPRWAGVVDGRNPMLRAVPLWVAAAVAGTLLVGLHLALSLRLNEASDPVFARLHRVSLASEAPPPPAPAVAPRLAQILAREIAAGLVGVTETTRASTVTLHGDRLFASGSDIVAADTVPVVERIAEALKNLPGRVAVVGHTDDQRIASARFPSNWHLSVARARSVMTILATRTGTPDRFVAEGRADTEPLVPNDSATNRARNRRVEVIIAAPGS